MSRPMPPHRRVEHGGNSPTTSSLCRQPEGRPAVSRSCVDHKQSGAQGNVPSASELEPNRRISQGHREVAGRGPLRCLRHLDGERHRDDQATPRTDWNRHERGREVGAMWRRGGRRPHRYIVPGKMPVWVSAGRWEPRRARVEQCVTLRAELVYHQASVTGPRSPDERVSSMKGDSSWQERAQLRSGPRGQTTSARCLRCTRTSAPRNS